MAIQNTKNIPNRITKKKYFYDPSLEKGIPNNITEMDSTGSSRHYFNICFCPDNNKLYLLWRDTCSGAGTSCSSFGIDVICPNSTTKLSEPEATITDTDLESTIQRRGALVYCPNIKRILFWTEGTTFTGVIVINPKTNTIEQKVVSGKKPYGYSVVYNPNDNKLYSVGSSDQSGLAGSVSSARAINTGKISYDGSVTGISEEDNIFSFGTYGAAHAIAVNPNKNELHVAGEGEGLVKITKDKNNYNYYDTTLMGANPTGSQTAHWLWSMQAAQSKSFSIEDMQGAQVQFGFGPTWEAVVDDYPVAASNVIYCPYDKNMYWLATRGWGRNFLPFTGPGLVHDEKGIYTMVMVMNEHSASEPATRRIITKGTYRHMIYCPDNNMIYILGDSGFKMINPADNYSTTTVADWKEIAPYETVSNPSTRYKVGTGAFGTPLAWPSSNSFTNFHEFCYSPVNHRIYGVGVNSRVIYIDVTT
tara:strand:- start:570 stop:1994 length:1425 start_codon:yes stop_codon:yes gene_type:complete